MAQISKVKCDFICGTNGASFYCYECKQNLCVSCRAIHDQVPVTKNHAVTDLNQVDLTLSSQIHCESHNNAFIIFCKTCSYLICQDCLLSEHKEHEYLKIEEVAKDVRNAVTEMLADGESRLDKVVKMLTDINSTFPKQIEKDGKEQISKIESAATSFKSIIDLGQNLLVDEVSAHMHIEKEDIRMSISTLQNLKKELETSCQSLRQFLNVTHNTSLVASFPKYKSMMAQHDDIPKINPPEKIDDFNVRKFLDKSIANACERFKCDIYDKKDKENDALRHKLQEKQEEIRSLGEKIEKTETESKSYRHKLQEKLEEIQTLEEKIEKTEKQSQTYRQNLKDKEKDIRLLEDKIENQEEEIKILQEKIKKIETENDNFSMCREKRNIEEKEKTRVELETMVNASKVADKKIDRKSGKIVDQSSAGFKLVKDNNSKFQDVVTILIPFMEYQMMKFFCGDCRIFDNSPNYFDGVLSRFLLPGETEKDLKENVQSKIQTLNTYYTQYVYTQTEISDTNWAEIIREVHQISKEIFCFRSKGRNHVTLKSSQYEKLQAAKIKCEFVLGLKEQKQGRRGGRVVASEQNYKKDIEQGTTEDFGTKTKFSRSLSGGTTRISTSRPDELKFSTTEGLVVRVYVGNITQLNVDCIVNAAHENLSHGGGIADVMSRAAGYQLQDESDDYVRNHGQLKVAECITTPAYKLPYKCIIHAVGPRWYNYPMDKKKCGLDLKKTIENCLHEANGNNMETIAIPPISSGIFGVPNEVCVWQYRQAVIDYSAAHGHKTSLKEIHFMDNDAGMIRIIQEEFKTRLNVCCPTKKPTKLF